MSRYPACPTSVPALAAVRLVLIMSIGADVHTPASAAQTRLVKATHMKEQRSTQPRRRSLSCWTAARWWGT
jgi:hypothetical protein